MQKITVSVRVQKKSSKNKCPLKGCLLLGCHVPLATAHTVLWHPEGLGWLSGCWWSLWCRGKSYSLSSRLVFASMLLKGNGVLLICSSLRYFCSHISGLSWSGYIGYCTSFVNSPVSIVLFVVPFRFISFRCLIVFVHFSAGRHDSKFTSLFLTSLTLVSLVFRSDISTLISSCASSWVLGSCLSGGIRFQGKAPLSPCLGFHNWRRVLMYSSVLSKLSPVSWQWEPLKLLS